MKANEANLLSLLNKPQQFIIPIYQRTYSWKEKQCEQLLKDILRISQDDQSTSHFIGSIVYFQEGIYTTTAIPQRLVIDGQQRLTTISLIILALIDVIKQDQLDIEITEKKLRNYYLLNTDEENKLRYKLLLTRKDTQTLIDLIEGNEPDESASKILLRNYGYFQSRVTRANAKHVLKGLQRLLIVDVALEYGKDNPQLIFESLNSTGLDLSQADLIRNYILMDLPPDTQKEMYDKYWYPTERIFGEKYNEMFDWFMRDYLTFKTGVINRVDAIYDGFKKYVQPNGKSYGISELLSDLYSNAINYAKFALLSEESKELRMLFSCLVSMRVNVAYPFLLSLYDDYKQNILSEKEFIQITGHIESYIYRRAICGIPTNSLNKTFATFKKYVDKEKYLQSVEAHFLLMDSYKRYPGDEEFSQYFLSKDLYNTRLIKYALDRIENYGRKEKVNIDDYTIEHVMPQNPNLSTEWQEQLGNDWKRVQEQYLHSIGNLTLTGYNSELSDRSFNDKKTMEGGFADSPIRLNERLGKLIKWDEDEIIIRAEIICQKAIDIWKVPVLDRSILDLYKTVIRTPQSKIPHNLVDLIIKEPSVVPALTSAGYVRFKPLFLLNIRDKLVDQGFIDQSLDMIKSYLFWYEFVIFEDRIRFAFLIGDHPDQEARKRIYDVFCKYSHYFHNVDRALRKNWHTVYSRDIITNDEYEMIDEEGNEELFTLITDRFREVMDIDLPKINEALASLVESDLPLKN